MSSKSIVNTEYKPEHCATVYKFMSAGLSKTQAMAQLGVARSTFYKWEKDHPEFKEAVDRGQVQFDAKHEELGVHGMLKTMDIEYQFWRDLAKYRHEGRYSDKPVGGTTNNTQINIDNMNVLNEQSNEELLIYIKNKLEENPELQQIIEGEVVED